MLNIKETHANNFVEDLDNRLQKYQYQQYYLRLVKNIYYFSQTYNKMLTMVILGLCY